MCSVSDNRLAQLNIGVELPPQTNDETLNAHGSSLIAARQPIAFLKRIWSNYVRPGTLVEEAAMTPGSVQLNTPPAETAYAYQILAISATRAFEYLNGVITNYFSPQRSGEEAVMMSESVFAKPVEVTAETNTQTANTYRFRTYIEASWPIVSLERMWTDYIRPGRLGEEDVMTQGSITDNEAERSIVVEQPAETDYFWHGALEEEGVMTPRLAFKVVIIGLFGFAAIKFQGGTKSPFQTHPWISMVSVTSMLMYGLASYVISALPPGLDYVYASIRLVGKLCLYIYVGTFISLFYI